MTKMSRVELTVECMEFLHHEAQLLDDGDLEGWLELLAEDIDYRVPVRTALERCGAAESFATNAFHMVEDLATLRTRVARLASDHSWAETPPSRTRRLVGNVRAEETSRDSEVAVRSNLFLFRAFGDQDPVIISCERHDVLRMEADAWRLARRLVLLDHTSLPMINLAVFL